MGASHWVVLQLAMGIALACRSGAGQRRRGGMVVGFCWIGLVAAQEDAKHRLRDFLAVSSIEHCKLLLLRAMACRCAEKCEDAGIGGDCAKPNGKPAESRGQVRIKPVASGSCWPTVKTKCEQLTGPKRAEKGKTE